MHLGLRFRSGFALRLKLGLGILLGLSAGVGIPTVIDIPVPVCRCCSQWYIRYQAYANKIQYAMLKS